MRASFLLVLSSLVLGAVVSPLAAQVPSGAPATNAPDATAIVASLKSQLRNLVSAEEAFYADRNTYSNSLKALGYVAREGAFVMVFRADNRGWGGRAVHPDLPGKSCVIWVNLAAEAQPKTDATEIKGREGEPVCDAT